MMYQTHTTGFTFVETLVAITVLLIALVVPLTVVTDATRGNTTANQQVIAFFLAQEGLELAQQLRDQGSLNYIDGGSTGSEWIIDHADNINGTDYTDCIGSSNWCGLDRFSPSVHAEDQGAVRNCSLASNCRLYQRSGGGNMSYTHNSGGAVETPYTRRIRITDEGAGEAKITAEVTWRSGFLLQEQRVQISTTVFNFYEQ